ncbi:MAG: hypothetical protein RLZZ403_596, partial [Pseudomonadota bacterium]
MSGDESAPGTAFAAGLNVLRGIGEVDVAPTPRDEVYREDKLVLYRYRPLDSAAAALP